MSQTWKNPGLDLYNLSAISTMVGTNDTNNTQSTSLVTSNADGSVVERLEYIQTAIAALATYTSPATFNPVLGYRVTKTEDVNTATSDDLFTLTGKVLITLWTGEVTNALNTSPTDYQITLTTLAGVLLAAGNIASAIVGHIFTLNADAGDTALSTSSSAVSVAGVGDTNGKGGHLVVGIAGGSDVIKSVRTAGASGDAIIHTVYYWPLEAGASLVAAA